MSVPSGRGSLERGYEPDGVVVDDEDAVNADPGVPVERPLFPVVRVAPDSPLVLGTLAVLELDALSVDQGADELAHDERALEHEALVLQRAPLDVFVSNALVLVRLGFGREEQLEQSEVEEAVVPELPLEALLVLPAVRRS